MTMRKFRSDGLTEETLSVIYELGMVTRRVLSTIIYMTEDDGTTIQCREKPTPLVKAVNRLRTAGYVKDMVYDGEKYLTVTDLGKDYVKEYGLPESNAISGLSVENAAHRKIIVAYSDALTFSRSARILSLPSEKPSFSSFAATAGALTVFDGRRQYAKEEMLDDLNVGICYSKKEIRDAYEQSSITSMKHNSSRKIGVVFGLNRISYIYQMAKKNDVLTARSEVEFDRIIKNDFEQFYRQNGGYHTRAYILVSTMNYLPTFFHGSVDGIEAKNEFIRPTNTREEGLAKFKIDKLPLYGKIYMLPVGERYVDYREAVDNYTDADYEYDKAGFEKTHPGETNVIICRYPELTQLRRTYTNYDHCTIVGPGDDKTVDLLSRCMRNRLLKYYDIDSGKEIKFKRYNSKGLPLIGNTNQIDYDAPWKLGGKFKKR